MKLPVLVTVPHGGSKLPPEASACVLTPHQIALDGDTWARWLYDLQDKMLGFKDTAVPRAVVDLNRAPYDLPPTNPDGAVKTVTVDGSRIWAESGGPRPELIRTLLERYHEPWHEAVDAASSVPGLTLGLDCHTMLAIGPQGHPLAGKPRPLVCLSNGGDARGLKSDRSLTAPTELALSFLENLALAFRNEDVEVYTAKPPVRLNHPFRGGYVSRRHSAHGPLPWLQLELSRALYLPTDFSLEPGATDLRRLADLRKKILKALQRTL